MPHLRALVQRFEDRPFAVVGVNAFDEAEDYQRGLLEHKISWISAFQGDNPIISEVMRVEGYPTYFLIDADGKLIKSSHSSTDYDAPIAKLLAALKEQQGE